jgi:putative transcriptional regulator
MAKKKGKEPLRLNRLRVILADKAISQTEFGEMINVDRNTISRICTNRTEPSLKLLYKMAYALKIEVADLLTPLSSIQEFFPLEDTKE